MWDGNAVVHLLHQFGWSTFVPRCRIVRSLIERPFHKRRRKAQLICFRFGRRKWCAADERIGTKDDHHLLFWPFPHMHYACCPSRRPLHSSVSFSLCSTLFLSPFHSTLGAGGARVMHLHNIAAVTVNIDLTDLYSNKGEFERETTRYRLHCRYICHSPSATHRVLLTEFYWVLPTERPLKATHRMLQNVRRTELKHRTEAQNCFTTLSRENSIIALMTIIIRVSLSLAYYSEWDALERLQDSMHLHFRSNRFRQANGTSLLNDLPAPCRNDRHGHKAAFTLFKFDY